MWKHQAEGSQSGRSMVEMLGVLAIIGVLSVGAIAGYSQAMGKYRANKTINDYNQLIMGILEHRNDYLQLPRGTHIISYLRKQDLIPSDFKRIDETAFSDLLKNKTRIWAQGDSIILEIYFALVESEANMEACNFLIRDLFYPLRDSIESVGLWRGYNADGVAGSGYKNRFYGEKNCTKDVQCLKDLTAARIQEHCGQVCESGRNCSVVVAF